MVAMQLGGDWDIDLCAWRSADGVNWSRLGKEVSFESGWASFEVEGFSSYSLTIPEPSAGLLLLMALALLMAIGRRPLRRDRRDERRVASSSSPSAT